MLIFRGFSPEHKKRSTLDYCVDKRTLLLTLGLYLVQLTQSRHAVILSYYWRMLWSVQTLYRPMCGWRSSPQLAAIVTCIACLSTWQLTVSVKKCVLTLGSSSSACKLISYNDASVMPVVTSGRHWKWSCPLLGFTFHRTSQEHRYLMPTFAILHFYDMIWYDMIWYDMIRYDTIRYDMIEDIYVRPKASE